MSSFQTASSAAAPPSASRRGLAALALVAALLPLVLANAYTYDVAILVGLNAITCVGLNILIGYAGQISLGHAGFFGLGAYGSAILASRYGVPVPLALLISVMGVGALAWLIGRPILRLRGHYLAMGTLGMGVIASVVLATEDRVTGGPDGMAVPPMSLLGFVVSGEKTWYWIVAAALIAAVWLAQNLIESPRGRALRALHGSEVGASALGIDPARHKLGAFVLSAVFAAVSGALTAHYSGFITPGKASFLHSIELVTMVVFGGMASTFGAVVGAAVLTTLPQLLTVLKEYEMVTLGAVMMLTMIVMPAGLVPTLEKVLAVTRRKSV
ncbi:MAG TPA: branched-chain amino acid ABC transporter permease [Burkholderiales bacterium]|nr:branched-chain amino acid ABC transporter permease [Burkholderiales bacterium]